MTPPITNAPGLPIGSPWVWGVPLLAAAAAALIFAADANRSLFLYLNAAGFHTDAALWANFTALGDSLVMLTLLLPFARRHPRLVWAALLGGLLSILWVHGFKNVMPLPRPPGVLTEEVFNTIGRPHTHNTFPSGHTTTAVLFVAVISLYWQRLVVAVPLVILALLVGWSRIVVGVHWPLDVLGGFFGGWLAGLGGLWWASRWRWTASPQGQITAGLFLSLCAVALLFHDSGYGQARPLQIVIALVALATALPQLAAAVRRPT